MAKLVTGIFKTRSSSMLTVEDLMRHGIPQEDISVQMTDTTNGREFFTDLASKAPEGGVTGTVIGAVLGGLIAALCAMGYLPDPNLGLPGIGVTMATLVGIGAGSIVGLIIGLMVGSAIPEYETNFYAVDKKERHGGLLVGVYCHERREGEVRKLIEAAGGRHLRSRSLATEPIRVHTTREYANVGMGTEPRPSRTSDIDTLPPADREI